MREREESRPTTKRSPKVAPKTIRRSAAAPPALPAAPPPGKSPAEKQRKSSKKANKGATRKRSPWTGRRWTPPSSIRLFVHTTPSYSPTLVDQRRNSHWSKAMLLSHSPTSMPQDIFTPKCAATKDSSQPLIYFLSTKPPPLTTKWPLPSNNQ